MFSRRRRVESLATQAEAQHFKLEATYFTLTSKLVLAAIQDASLRDEIASAEHSIALRRRCSRLRRLLETLAPTELDLSYLGDDEPASRRRICSYTKSCHVTGVIDALWRVTRA